jgi:hypothetical protein
VADLRRYGFGPATEAAEWTIDKLRVGAPAPTGELEQVSTERLLELGAPVYDRARRQRAGGLTGTTCAGERQLGLLRPEGDPGWDGRASVHRDADGEVDGYLRWRAEWGDGAGQHAHRRTSWSRRPTRRTRSCGGSRWPST